MPPNSDDIRRQLLDIFRQEQTEHLQAVRTILAAAAFSDTGKVRPLTAAERDEVYRRIHSLKGAARAVDMEAVERLAHRMEAVLGQLRGGTLILPESRLYPVLIETLDAFEVLALSEDSQDPSIRSAAQNTMEAVLANLAALEGSVPLVEPLPEPHLPAEIPLAPVPVAVQNETASEVVRVPIADLDLLMASARQFHREMERQQLLMDTELNTLEQHLSGEGMAGKERAIAEIRALRRRGRERTWRLRRMGGQLLDDVQATRLVPAESATEGMEQMLRGIARQSGKEVNLQIIGGDIRVDRQVAQALRDPLTHLLRNTISHGIERPAERIAAGKPGAGAVELRFRVRGTQLEIEIQDDGIGLDLEAIHHKGIATGLLSADTNTPEEIAQLIFQPGFSTIRSGAADRLAGRGMGLSIVSQTVARLGGEVLAQPRNDGPGTQFRLLLPLSVANHRLLLVEVGGQVFGLPTFVVEELHRVPYRRLEQIEGRTVVRLAEKGTLRLADMGRLLGLPSLLRTEADPESRLSLIVVRLRGERFAIAVSGFRQEGDFLVRPLGPFLQTASLFSGSVVLGDGTIGLALLPAELAQRLRATGRPGVAPSAMPAMMPPVRLRRQRTILVADDSITTRTLEKSILEAHGYRVRLAVDGEEALVLLRESTSLPDRAIDLVVSDLEMPRRNGFELLAAVKADERLAHIPLILVTSREAFEDREMGLSLGADAYIVKRKFDQTDLLETIEQLLGKV